MRRLLEAMPESFSDVLFILACGVAIGTVAFMIGVGLSCLPWRRWYWVLRAKTVGPVWEPPCNHRERRLRGQYFLGCIGALNADQVYPWDDLWLNIWPDTDVFTLTRVDAAKPSTKNYSLDRLPATTLEDPMWGDHLRRALARKRVMKKVAAVWKNKYDVNPIRYARCMEAIRGNFT